MEMFYKRELVEVILVETPSRIEGKGPANVITPAEGAIERM